MQSSVVHAVAVITVCLLHGLCLRLSCAARLLLRYCL
jgi:hypothetical protein